MSGIVKYTKFTTSGRDLIPVTNPPYSIDFKPFHTYIFFSNEANSHDVYISVNDQDQIRVPALSFVEIANQRIYKLTIHDSGDFEYIARY